MKALKGIIVPAIVVAPAAIRTATHNSSAIDMQGVNANLIVVEAGAITDGTFTPKLQESDASGSGYSDVAAADQVGTLAACTANAQQAVSYIGSKRYVRVVDTVTGSPSTGGYISAYALLEKKKQS